MILDPWDDDHPGHRKTPVLVSWGDDARLAVQTCTATAGGAIREHDEGARGAPRCTPDARRSGTHRGDAGDAAEHPDLSRRAPRCARPAGTRRAGGPAPRPCRWAARPGPSDGPQPCNATSARPVSAPSTQRTSSAVASSATCTTARSSAWSASASSSGCWPSERHRMTIAPRSTSSGAASRTRWRTSGA